MDPSLSGQQVLFAPASGPGVGGGHVLRCLTLAGALTARGVRCAFAVNPAGAALIERFGGGAVVTHEAPPQTVLDSESFDTLAIDDYALSADEERPLRDAAKRLIIIDDLADRPHLADLLIDPGYGRDAADYEALLPRGAAIRTGPAYALVNPVFARLRRAALARPIAPAPRRLFLSFGLSDIGGVAARAVATVRTRFPDAEIDLALSSEAESVPALKGRVASDPALRLHLDAADIADLMAAADLAIGAGGASTWERACLGLPTLAVIVADNQRPTIQGLAADGALLAVELGDPAFESAFDDALLRIWRQDMRAALRTASAALCDGMGAARVADAILDL